MPTTRLFRHILSLTLLLILSGFTLKACTQPPKEAMKPITLTWWRVFDDTGAVQPSIDAFRRDHPTITVNVRRLRFEEYEDELLNALAEDRGPDIISLHNTWIGKYKSKLTPMPASTTLPYQFLTGTIKKEVMTELRTTPSISLRRLRENFLDVVADDVIQPDFGVSGQPPKEQVFGLPLSVDTLVLYYNRDLLNAAGIPEAARTWSELQEHVRKLTKLDKEKILQSGIALGASANIPRSTDILSLLMMQNGAEMADEQGFATFDRIPPGFTDRNVPPGEEALSFFTDFANPTKEVYTWNKTLPDALEFFASGRLGYFLGYSYQLPLIRSRAPKLKFGITKVPQIESTPEINFANYWVESVSKKSTQANAAWAFIQFMTGADQVRNYLTAAKRPPALRALIPEFSEDPDLSAFANQLLTTKSWYKGVNAPGAERILGTLIDSVASGDAEPLKALQFSVGQINQ
ncbi:MAG: extracellular solute-binding protein, partial [bacterium]|nr:extracellular solute-binding protein [bacterium]